jgi:hypothetical protein
MTGSSPLVELAGALVAVGPRGLVVEVEPSGDDGDHLAGRRAARRAAGGPVGRGDRGRPVWPPGTIGSISHSGGVAVAVAVPARGPVLALGVDIDVAGSLPADDAELVCSAAERRLLAAAGSSRSADELATQLWVVKEAAFKAWDASTGGALWGCEAASLEVDGPPGRPCRVVPGPALARLRLPVLEAASVSSGGLVAALAWASG